MWPRSAGAGTSVNDLVLRLDKQRFRIIFIYLSGHGNRENIVEKLGYEAFYLSNIKKLNAFRFSILFKLIGILRKNNVNLLHCHAHKSTVYGTIAAMFAGKIKVLAHVHGLGRSKGFRRKLTNYFLFKHIKAIIPVAEAVKKM